MLTVSKEMKWASSHRLMNKDGTKFYPKEKCGSGHGHEYFCEFTFTNYTSSELDKTTCAVILEKCGETDEFGFVIDFSDIKKIVQTWIDENWDHVTIVHPKDKSLIEFLIKEGDRFFIMPEGYTTSAESMAMFLFKKFENLLPEGVILLSVSVWETLTSKATYSKDKRWI